jgi:hypothetical protein
MDDSAIQTAVAFFVLCYYSVGVVFAVQHHLRKKEKRMFSFKTYTLGRVLNRLWSLPHVNMHCMEQPTLMPGFYPISLKSSPVGTCNSPPFELLFCMRTQPSSDNRTCPDCLIRKI